MIRKGEQAHKSLYFAVPYELLVPDQTRDALFQLACDLRANPIKNKHWVLVHWRRLKPRTFPGWIVRPLASATVLSALKDTSDAPSNIIYIVAGGICMAKDYLCPKTLGL